MRIGLLSDTHGHLDERIFHHFKEVDEVWHAGDIGTIETIDTLEAFKPTRAVYGNIDNHLIRAVCPQHQRFTLNNLDFWITHIGGYPGNYSRYVKESILANPPDVFICGHSHILKVMRDPKLNLLHLNPGACGIHGFHKMRTMLRFTIGQGRLEDLEVIELGSR